MAEFFVIVTIFVVFILIIYSCCRQFKKAYHGQLLNHFAAERDHALNFGLTPGAISDLSGLNSGDRRACNVATISADATLPAGLYELRFPPTSYLSRYCGRINVGVPVPVHPPPPFHVAVKSSAPLNPLGGKEEPPPTYEEYMSLERADKDRVPEESRIQEHANIEE